MLIYLHWLCRAMREINENYLMKNSCPQRDLHPLTRQTRNPLRLEADLIIDIYR